MRLSPFLFCEHVQRAIQKVMSALHLKILPFSNILFRLVLSLKQEIGFDIVIYKKTGKQDVTNFIEIGWVEAENMTV